MVNAKYLYLPASALTIASLISGHELQAQQSSKTYTYDALGRVVGVEVSGGSENGHKRDYQYDLGSNRVSMKASGSASSGNNRAPVTQDDTVSVLCYETVVVDVTSNDHDPDGDPITIIDASEAQGYGTPTILAPNRISFEAWGYASQRVVTYTVADSSNATATGTLNITVTGSYTYCDNA